MDIYRIEVIEVHLKFIRVGPLINDAQNTVMHLLVMKSKAKNLLIPRLDMILSIVKSYLLAVEVNLAQESLGQDEVRRRKLPFWNKYLKNQHQSPSVIYGFN